MKRTDVFRRTSTQPSQPAAVGENRERIRTIEFLLRRSKFGGGKRIVYGAIYNDASVIDPGSGDWTVVLASTNEFTITFDPPFTTLPTVVATPNNNNATGDGFPKGYFTGHTERASDHVVIRTWHTDGTVDAGGFDFIAIAAT
jgi:hypothetical protein